MKFAPLIVFLMMGMASHTQAADCNCPDVASDPFTGVWESSYGHLFFTYRTSKSEIETNADGKGIRAAFWSYPDSHGVADNGRILGTVSGNTLNGHWIQDSGGNACETEMDGSKHWGTVRFTVSEDFNEIGGVWGLCDQKPEGDDADWIMWRDEIRNWNPEEE